MKIKKGDIIKIITGKDKGKTGKVIKSNPTKEKIVVEGLNLLVKHAKARKKGEKGQKIYFPAALGISKVMLMCPKCNKATRVGFKIVKSENLKNKKERVCRKCKQTIS